MQPPLLLLMLFLIATVSASPLHPKQLKSLQFLNIPINKDPCNNVTHSSITITCDSASPYRHITSLSFTNCSSTLTLTSKTLKPLSKSLISLSFNECPTLIPPHHLPISLHSFSADYSFLDNHQGQQLTGTYIARLIKLRTLKISTIPISTSNHLCVILGNMHRLKSLTISNSNLTGVIPKSFHSNLTHIDLSYNSLKGSIRNSITRLRHLKFLDLSHNSLSGKIPNKIENLIWLNTLSLASNNLSGTIPNSISSISELTYVDLSRNKLNGTVPLFFFKMKNLKHLNLAENSFRGVLPFNESFIKNLVVFKIRGNSELCYNKSVLSSKLELGISPCDRYGLPLWSTSQKKGPTLSGENDYGDYNGERGIWKMENEEEDNGSNKALFGVGITLCSLVFLIIFLIYLAKRCRCI